MSSDTGQPAAATAAKRSGGWEVDERNVDWDGGDKRLPATDRDNVSGGREAGHKRQKTHGAP
jgi:hypothetical protein